jgi:hypothetical protein
MTNLFCTHTNIIDPLSSAFDRCRWIIRSSPSCIQIFIQLSNSPLYQCNCPTPLCINAIVQLPSVSMQLSNSPLYQCNRPTPSVSMLSSNSLCINSIVQPPCVSMQSSNSPVIRVQTDTYCSPVLSFLHSHHTHSY